jgi:hypothetical protein
VEWAVWVAGAVMPLCYALYLDPNRRVFDAWNPDTMTSHALYEVYSLCVYAVCAFPRCFLHSPSATVVFSAQRPFSRSPSHLPCDNPEGRGRRIKGRKVVRKQQETTSSQPAGIHPIPSQPILGRAMASRQAPAPPGFNPFAGSDDDHAHHNNRETLSEASHDYGQSLIRTFLAHLRLAQPRAPHRTTLAFARFLAAQTAFARHHQLLILIPTHPSTPGNTQLTLSCFPLGKIPNSSGMNNEQPSYSRHNSGYGPNSQESFGQPPAAPFTRQYSMSGSSTPTFNDYAQPMSKLRAPYPAWSASEAIPLSPVSIICRTTALQCSLRFATVISTSAC